MKTSYEHIKELLSKLSEYDISKAESTKKYNFQEIYHIAQLMDVHMNPSKGEFITHSDFEDTIYDIRKNYSRYNLTKYSDVVMTINSEYFKRYYPHYLWWAYLLIAESMYNPDKK